MGKATVRMLLNQEYRVTVWNRTSAKAERMAAEGTASAATVSEAVRANEVTILSLTDYTAMYDVLSQAENALDGKVIVNLSSGTPQEARDGAKWVDDRGGTLFTGGFISQSDDIEHELSYVLYSGPQRIYDQYWTLLQSICRPEYLGDDPGLSQLYYQAMLALFHPFLLTVQQSISAVDDANGDSGRFAAFAADFTANLTEFVPLIHRLHQQGANDNASDAMMRASAGHVADTFNAAGVDDSILRAVERVYENRLGS